MLAALRRAFSSGKVNQAGLPVIFSSRLFFTSLEDTASFCFLHYTSKTLSHQL